MKLISGSPFRMNFDMVGCTYASFQLKNRVATKFLTSKKHPDNNESNARIGKAVINFVQRALTSGSKSFNELENFSPSRWTCSQELYVLKNQSQVNQLHAILFWFN